MKTDNTTLKTYLRLIGRLEGMECFINYLIHNTDYLTAPASAYMHSCYEGGLVDHSVSVVNHLLILSEKLNFKWSRPESPYIIGMFHDVCKTNFYKKVIGWRKDENNKWEQYDKYEFDDQAPLGHGEKSVMICLTHGAHLTDQELFCIRWHMGAFDLSPSEQKQFTAACHKYPELLAVCMADMLAGIKEDIGYEGGELFPNEEEKSGKE